MKSNFPFILIALTALAPGSCTRATMHHESPPPRRAASSAPTKMLAVYEPWFGHPNHINVGYSSQDPTVLQNQIEQAKKLGVSGFVVDWYGDREPFLDKSYALLQSIAAKNGFNVAMMFDESNLEADLSTDDAMVALDEFRKKYLSPEAPGYEAYLTYEGRPVIFIFPKGGHTDWNRVRAETEKWNPAPLLIYEYRQTPFAGAFDGFYAWINPGQKGWATDGSNWGEDYLNGFYKTMQTKYQDKIAVGAVWPGFDDRKASWSLGRYMSRRCGDTLGDTMNLYRQNSQDDPMPFLLIATWNDYEEGSAIERDSEKCLPVSKALAR